VPAVFTVMLLPVEPLLQVTVPLQPYAVSFAVSVPHRLVLSVTIVGGVDMPPVVITTAFELPLVPQAVVQIAVYVPAVPTVMLLPVEPLLHFTVPPQAVAVKVAFSSPHKLALSLVIIGALGVPPVVIITAFELPLVPQAVVQVAVYVPAVPTVMLLPVEPLLHLTVPPQPLAVKVAFSTPHKLILSALMVGADGVPPLVITNTFEVALVPQAFTQTAVYVPAVLTVIPGVVAFVLHFNVPVHPVAVNVAVSLPHRLNLSAVTVGADGVAPVVIITAFEARLVPQLLIQTAVYVPATLTVILLPVAALLHFTVPPQPVAVSVAVSSPQRLVLLLVTTGGVGVVFFLITTPALGSLSLQAFIHIAVYVPPTLTEILLVVAPVLHLIVPLHPIAVNVAFSVPQITFVLVATTGTVGVGAEVIVIVLLTTLSPQLDTHLAV